MMVSTPGNTVHGAHPDCAPPCWGCCCSPIIIVLPPALQHVSRVATHTGEVETITIVASNWKIITQVSATRRAHARPSGYIEHVSFDKFFVSETRPAVFGCLLLEIVECAASRNHKEWNATYGVVESGLSSLVHFVEKIYVRQVVREPLLGVSSVVQIAAHCVGQSFGYIVHGQGFGNLLAGHVVTQILLNWTCAVVLPVSWHLAKSQECCEGGGDHCFVVVLRVQ